MIPNTLRLFFNEVIMNRYVKLLIAVLCIPLTACCFSGCGLFGQKPPSEDKIKAVFAENEDAFKASAKYLLSFEEKFSNLDNVYITKPDEVTVYTRQPGTVYLDKKVMKIEEAAEDISALFSAGCKSIGMSGSANINSSSPNSIYYRMWSATIYDIDCGIAVSKDEGGTPKTEFMTKLSPISDDGWYYYVSDYEEWREAQ